MSNPFDLLGSTSDSENDSDHSDSTPQQQRKESLPSAVSSSAQHSVQEISEVNSTMYDFDGAGVLPVDLKTTIEVISWLGANITAFKTKRFKKLRSALHPLIQYQYQSSYEDESGSRGSKGKNKRKREKDLSTYQDMKELDRKYHEQTALRNKRMKFLETLAEQGRKAGTEFV